MNRRIFLASFGAIGFCTLMPGSAVAQSLALGADGHDACSLRHIDGLALLSTCPAICLKEIHAILSQDELVSIDLDNLRFILSGADKLTYLHGSASGNNATQETVRKIMHGAPNVFHGIDKLLVMFTCNQSHLRLNDLEKLQSSIAKYAGKEACLVMGTINNTRMLPNEVRIGMLVPNGPDIKPTRFNVN